MYTVTQLNTFYDLQGATVLYYGKLKFGQNKFNSQEYTSFIEEIDLTHKIVFHSNIFKNFLKKIINLWRLGLFL